mmetsp:Transcript_119598/g.208257  ORF Transcript_119598/g.208257 Transcript_119598/m.208257 type:complete len:208 (+) Transcript_119598:938-1561(+)
MLNTDWLIRPWSCIDSQRGRTPPRAMVSKARPTRPSYSLPSMSATLCISPKMAFLMTPPRMMVSSVSTPVADPLPYLSSKNSPRGTYVEDLDASYRWWPLQDEHLTEGTHVLEDPVSKMTVNVWGGVPMDIFPKYCMSTKLERGTGTDRPSPVPLIVRAGLTNCTFCGGWSVFFWRRFAIFLRPKGSQRRRFDAGSSPSFNPFFSWV